MNEVFESKSKVHKPQLMRATLPWSNQVASTHRPKTWRLARSKVANTLEARNEVNLSVVRALAKPAQYSLAGIASTSMWCYQMPTLTSYLQARSNQQRLSSQVVNLPMVLKVVRTRFISITTAACTDRRSRLLSHKTHRYATITRTRPKLHIHVIVCHPLFFQQMACLETVPLWSSKKKSESTWSKLASTTPTRSEMTHQMPSLRSVFSSRNAVVNRSTLVTQLVENLESQNQGRDLAHEAEWEATLHNCWTLMWITLQSSKRPLLLHNCLDWSKLICSKLMSIIKVVMP